MRSSSAAARLISRFTEFCDQLTGDELQNWHLLLSAMVGDMADGHSPPAEREAAEAWWVMVRAITGIYPGGAVRLGRVGALQDGLDGLAAESAEMIGAQVRYGAAISGTVESGVLATGVAHDPLLLDEMSRRAGVPLEGPTSVSYFYYHQPGDHLLPHADPIISSGVICLTTLVHTPREDGKPPSAFVVYPPEGAPQRFELEQGESVMFFGGGTVHAREPIGPGETVINLSIGFAYADRRPAPLWGLA